MSTNNIGFYEDLTKIIFQLSSNMHLISSSVNKKIYIHLPSKNVTDIFNGHDLNCIYSKNTIIRHIKKQIIKIDDC